MPHPNVPRNIEVAFTTLCHDARGPAEPRQAALRTADDYRTWFAGTGRHGVPAPESEMDFGGETVIAVAAGAKRTAGHTIEILKVLQQVGGFVGIQALIFYRETAPGATSTEAETLSYCPQHVIRVAKPLPRILSFHKVDALSDIPPTGSDT